ncbi:MAG: NapC/NirT family cytochrome c [Myxococcales bacterium]|nr:NapC/NirT family cytochrome c [Myxococcales bacterium]
MTTPTPPPSSAPAAAKAPEPSSPKSAGPKSARPARPPLYFNIVSHIGGLIVVLAAILIAISMVVEVRSGALNPYVGIFTYMVFPGVLASGAVLFLLGMRWEAGRRRKLESLATLPYPRIDLNDGRQRRIFAFSSVGGVVVATLMVWASYQGFHFTESVYFCGQVCHVPMRPEFVAYSDSAHARVPCTECHVGEGAGWYVRSKLSGVRQVLAVATNKYARPIPTPIAHLRPARETCERCHWPEKFFGAKLLQLPHFRYTENNEPEQISLTLKTGGGAKSHGQSQGIHWHMLVSNEVTYAAADDKLQVIPWTKVKHADGKETVYIAKKTKLSPAAIDALPRRKMDCMDCHNRPAHDFPTPDSGVDEALLKGRIPADLPWIKKATVEALFRVYPSRQAAHDGIGQYIIDYYKKEKPEVLEQRRKDVDTAIEVAKTLYDRGVFPDMKVDWQTYPKNLGHRYWAGCFRCHDGKHVSADGKVLANDCESTCHTAPVRGSVTELGAVDPKAQPNWHPWEMPKEHLDVEGHDTVKCHACHNAGQRPSKECDDCHEK